MLKKQAEQALFFYLPLLPFSSPILSSPFQILFFRQCDFRANRTQETCVSAWLQFPRDGRKCFTDLEVYACINPMLFMFSIMAFFVHVTDKLQRARVINYNQGLIL